MFVLHDVHIDFIRKDIRQRGIERDAMLDDIVDHVCCLLEGQLQNESEFHAKYLHIIGNFYGKSILDIEKETQLLIQFKNYYAMKKTMLYSGAFAAIALVAGLILKFTHSPGASFLVLVGIITFGFLFLPLMVVLKSREDAPKRDKVLTFVGSLCVLLFALGTLFKIMYWPYANMLGVSAMVAVGFVYIPLLFFTGVRNPETRNSATVTTIVLITGLGLVLMLIRSPHATQAYQLQRTAAYLEQERMLEAQQNAGLALDMQAPRNLQEIKLDSMCLELKRLVLEMELNQDSLPIAILNGTESIPDGPMQKTLLDDEQAAAQMQALQSAIDEYNKALQRDTSKTWPVRSALFMKGEMRTVDVLSALTKIRHTLLLNR